MLEREQPSRLQDLCSNQIAHRQQCIRFPALQGGSEGLLWVAWRPSWQALPGHSLHWHSCSQLCIGLKGSELLCRHIVQMTQWHAWHKQGLSWAGLGGLLPLAAALSVQCSAEPPPPNPSLLSRAVSDEAWQKRERPQGKSQDRWGMRWVAVAVSEVSPRGRKTRKKLSKSQKNKSELSPKTNVEV